MDLLIDVVDGGSPLGPISLATGAGALRALDFLSPEELRRGCGPRSAPPSA